LTFLIGVLVGLLGLGVMIFGIGFSALFVAARALFDRALKSELAKTGRASAEKALAAIRNP